MKRFLFISLLVIACQHVLSQTLQYPYPVSYLSLTVEQKPIRMAYMDVRPERANGETVLLFHGKNFNGYYWKDVIAFLSSQGYRVIVPDQVGWGLSDKPDIHYSFHLLASNTKLLLDTLRIQSVHIIGHSMGGMLATRFSLTYPQSVRKLILEDPIGLEDYRTFVPYTTIDEQYRKELQADYESLKKYQQGYYPEWKQEYEQYVQAQYQSLQTPGFKEATWASALTYDMIYQQPVRYEFKNLVQTTLIIVGDADRTIIGKNLLPPEVVKQHGNYPLLGKWLKDEIKSSSLIELRGVGHIPHIQAFDVFKQHVLTFLKTP